MTVYIIAHGCVAPNMKNGAVFPLEWSAYNMQNKHFITASLSRHQYPIINEIIQEYPELDPTTIYSIACTRLLNANINQQFPNFRDIFQIKQKSKPHSLLIHTGSARGATQSWEQTYQMWNEGKALRPQTSPLTTAGNISTHTLFDFCRQLNINLNNSTAWGQSQTCSSGLLAIANAVAWLKSNMADFALAGGIEAPISPYTLAQFDALHLIQNRQNISDNSITFPCRPFNQERKNSFVLGEGSAIFGLATDSFCSQYKLSRFLDLIAIDAIGFSTEPPPSLTGIGVEGTHFYDAFCQAYYNSMHSVPVDLIIAHAPGTVKGDEAEAKALSNIRKIILENQKEVPYIWSSKWINGHTLGASGSISLAWALEFIRGAAIPEFPFEHYINNPQPPKFIKKVAVLSAGFGGLACCMIISKI